VAVARAGEDAVPAVPAPAGLRPFLQFAKLPPRALVAARRALDADAEFRARVADDVSEADIGRAGWLFLSRPDGWEDEMATLARAAAEAKGEMVEERAVKAARRRRAVTDTAVRKAEEATAQARAEAAKAVAALAEERQGRRAAAREVGQLTRRLSETTSELERVRREHAAAVEDANTLKARAAELEAAVRAAPAPTNEPRPAPVQPAPAPAPPAPAIPSVSGSSVEVARALAAAAEAATRLAESLASASAAVDDRAAPSVPPALTGRSGPVTPALTGRSGPVTPALTGRSGPGGAVPRAPIPPRLTRTRVTRPRRVPSALPPAVLEESPEAAEHLVRLPGAILLVDGYNVSNAAWPGQPIAEQRRRLVDALTRLVARTGADVRVVFDGSDTREPPVVATTPRAVHVSFSPPGVEADDVILGQVGDLPKSRPVVVATSDRRVQSEAARQGANIVFSSQLLSILR
jgi:predicted RNA-binding protein with PIN domain